MQESTHAILFHAKFQLNWYILSPMQGQKVQFLSNFQVLGTPAPTPYLIRAKYGMRKCTHAKFYLNRYTFHPLMGEKLLTKSQFWPDFVPGAPMPTPHHQTGPNLVHMSEPTIYAYEPNFICIDLLCCPWGAKNQHSVVTPSSGTATKLNTVAQLQILPYPAIPKPFLYCNFLMAKLLAQTILFKSMTDKKQTAPNVPLCWWAVPVHQIWHGDRGPYRFCTTKMC